MRVVLTDGDGDGGISANYDTTVTVSGVNDAPVISNLNGDSLAYSEGDGAVVFEQGGNATVSDVDSADFNTGTLTVAFIAGSDSAEDVLAIRNQGVGAGQIGVSGSTVTYGGVTIGTFTGGSSGTNLVITLNGSATPTAVRALVNNLTYANTDTAAPTTGARTVRVVLTDGDGGTSANYDTIVTVSGVNDAPSLNIGKNPVLTAENEDAGAPVPGVPAGTLVSSLVDFSTPSGQVDNVTDPDSGAQLGIAVVEADTTNGTWWYSTNNGNTWNALGAVSGANARLLAADANTWIYFQPNANWSGTLANAITFHAWDQTSGTNGGTAVLTDNVTDQFSTVSYSNNDGTVNWTGNWVETDSGGGGASGGRIRIQGGRLDIRAEVVNNGLYREVNLSNATSAMLSFSYDNQLEDGDSIAVQISNNGGGNYTTLTGGIFSETFNNGTGTASFDITSSISANTRVRFLVTGEDDNQHLYVDNVQISFSSNTALTTAFSSATDTAALTVSSINDVPTITNLAGDSLAYSEGDGAVVVEQGGNATVSDVDSANFNTGTLTVAFMAGSDSAEDVLSIRNQGAGAGQIGVSGSTVTYGGVTIGTFIGGSGGSNLVITLNSSATPTVVTALVKNLTYENTDSAAPTTGARTVRVVLTDGDGGTSANYDTTVTVSGVNDAPTITNLSGDSLGYGERDGAVVIEQGGNATVADVDSADFDTGILTVSFAAGSDAAEDVLSIRNQGVGAGQIGVSGANVTYQGVTIGTFTGGSGGSNLVITLNSSATPTAMTALVKNLTFENTDSAAPTTGARTVRVVLTDGDGGTSANYDTTVTVSGVNDAPVNTVPGAQMVGEDGSLVFSAGTGNQISISDVDAAGGMMQITLIAANGTLTLNGTTGLSFITGDGTADGTMIFAGTVADINTALDGMGFLPALNYNGAASVQMTTDDQGNTGGGAQGDTDTVAITVTAVNDPPVNNIPGPQGTPQNTILVFSAGTGNQISISDVDAAGGMMQITLTAANGTLTLNGTTGLSFISGDGTDDGTMIFTGTVADINTALDGMGFLPALNYNGAASVQMTTDDQGNTGGGAQSDTDLLSIIVSNDFPPVIVLSGGSLSYTENDGAAAIDTGLTVADADTATLAGATVQITGSYVNGEDLLAFTNQLGITGSWNTGTGELTLTGSATVADYQTALRSITYTNLSYAPSTTTRTVSFSVNDGAIDSAITSRLITIAAVNDPPTASNLSGDSLAYAEGDGVVVIEQGGNTTVSDIDSADFNTGTLTVAFMAGSDSAEDVLSIRNQGVGAGQIGVGGATVTYGGVTIGTFTGGSGGSDLVITLNGSATPTAVTALVKNITYEDTDTGAPTMGARTVRFVLTDGDGGTSANYDTTVTVSSVNDAPVNTVPGAQSVNEDTPLSLTGISVNDVDGNLSTVQLGVLNGTVTVTLQGAAMISAGGNGTNTLTLSGTSADINATLASLVYQGTLNYTGADTLTVTSTDSNAVTDLDTVAMTVTPVNDAPVNTVPGAQSVNEDTPLSLTGISVNDVDGNLSTVQLGVLNGTVTVTLQGAAMISAGGNGTNTLTLSGTSADINATLASLVYQGTLNYTGADTLTVTSTDSNAVTDIDTVAMTVTPVNDAPVNTVPGRRV